MESPMDVVALGPDEKYKQTLLHHRVAFTLPAQFVMELVKLASIAQLPDGETSTGEQKTRALTPQEVVDRSVEIVLIATGRLEALGWIKEIPAFEALREDSSQVGFRPPGTDATKRPLY